MSKNNNASNKKTNIIIRTIISVFAFIGLSFAVYIFLTNSLESRDKYTLTYKETTDVNYNVCLKENNFYEEKCLDKDMKYVSSIIDQIHLTLKYNFASDTEASATYTYSIVGKIIISDPIDNKILFSKNYDLVSDIVEKSTNVKEHPINKVIDIDYSKYNNLANKFKSTYGVSSNARLDIHMYINNEGHSVSDEELKYNNSIDAFVSIPLTESSININTDSAILNNTNTLKHQTKLVVSNYYLFGAAVLSLIIGLYILVDLAMYFNRMFNDKTEYEKELRRLLREYDRLIVESTSVVDIDDYNIIMIKSFEELLDVHDNLKLPIIFNEIIKKKESWLYVKNEGDLYLYVLSLEDNGD